MHLSLRITILPSVCTKRAFQKEKKKRQVERRLRRNADRRNLDLARLPTTSSAQRHYILPLFFLHLLVYLKLKRKVEKLSVPYVRPFPQTGLPLFPLTHSLTVQTTQILQTPTVAPAYQKRIGEAGTYPPCGVRAGPGNAPSSVGPLKLLPSFFSLVPLFAPYSFSLAGRGHVGDGIVAVTTARFGALPRLRIDSR